MGRTAKSKRRKQSYYDYSMLILIIFIVAFGLIMVYSASSYTAQTHEKFGYDAAFFLKKQAGAALMGVAVMLIISKVDYRHLLRKLPVLRIRAGTLFFMIAIALQVIVLFVGDEVNGAKRWMKVGPVSVQPSEITKLAIIVFVAYIIYQSPKMMNNMLGFVRVLIYTAIPIGLVVVENLSTAIVICGIIFGMCYVASKKRWPYIVTMILAACGVAAIILFGESFRMERIEIWQNVETHEKGGQILQGLYAIASGGIFGTGLGQSMQKLGFIPESYNDMIFSIVCEELGLCGAIVVILIFVLIIWRIATIAVHAPDLYGSLLCVGTLVHISIQVIFNIAVVTNTIPSTGIPLPFVSYGGTSLMILLAEMGMVLSVSNKIEN